MTGTLNKANSNSTTFTDGNCDLQIGKVHSFVLLSNLEEVEFGNMSRADLLLVNRVSNKKINVLIFELKGVGKELPLKEINHLTDRIITKFNGTRKLLVESGKLITAIQGSKNLSYFYFLVITPEFKSQFTKIEGRLRERIGKSVHFEILDNSQVFYPNNYQ
ncbi:MAG: hypothetical protein ACYCXG_12695 [Acidiferrobacter sp.]